MDNWDSKFNKRMNDDINVLCKSIIIGLIIIFISIKMAEILNAYINHE